MGLIWIFLVPVRRILLHPDISLRVNLSNSDSSGDFLRLTNNSYSGWCRYCASPKAIDQLAHWLILLTATSFGLLEVDRPDPVTGSRFTTDHHFHFHHSHALSRSSLRLEIFTEQKIGTDLRWIWCPRMEHRKLKDQVSSTLLALSACPLESLVGNTFRQFVLPSSCSEQDLSLRLLMDRCHLCWFSRWSSYLKLILELQFRFFGSTCDEFPIWKCCSFSIFMMCPPYGCVCLCTRVANALVNYVHVEMLVNINLYCKSSFWSSAGVLSVIGPLVSYHSWKLVQCLLFLFCFKFPGWFVGAYICRTEMGIQLEMI